MKMKSGTIFILPARSFLSIDPRLGSASLAWVLETSKQRRAQLSASGSVGGTWNPPAALGTGAPKASRDTVPFRVGGEGLQKSSPVLLPQPCLKFSPCKGGVYLLQLTGAVN